MPYSTGTLLLMFLSGAAYADVLDHHSGVVAQLVHQTLGAHHLPFTLLLILVSAFVFLRWRAANK